ncbi:MAG: hypothetical protein FJX76_10250 [Armatimonadetes bacterium]|nr:hypothetical protein [Armatimonadota bacterium]
MKRLVLLVSLVLSLACAAVAETGSPLIPRIDELTGLVPRVSSSVLVANGPFPLPALAASQVPLKGVPKEAQFRALAVGLAPDVLEMLRAQTALGRVQQAVAAHDPIPEAPGIYNGTHVIMFEGELPGPNVTALLTLIAQEPVNTNFPYPVVMRRIVTADGSFPMYYAMPRTNVFVACSGLGAIQEVLVRSLTGSSGVNVPDSLQPYVDKVNTASLVWGMHLIEPLDYLWKNAPRDQWPLATLFEWKKNGARGRLTFYGNYAKLGDRTRQQFQRFPLRISEPEFGIVHALQRNGMEDNEFVALLMEGLGYGLSSAQLAEFERI